MRLRKQDFQKSAQCILYSFNDEKENTANNRSNPYADEISDIIPLGTDELLKISNTHAIT